MELAQSTVQQISTKAGVNRATTYVQLDLLKNRGLVSQVSMDKKTYFIAEKPSKVKKLIEREKSEIIFKENEFNKILPSLEAIFNAQKDRPGVRYYEGEDAINSFRDDLVKTTHKYFFAIAPVSKHFELTSEKEEVYTKLIKKIQEYKHIQVSDSPIPEITNFSKQYKQFKSKYIPKTKMNLEVEIALFDNFLWINSLKGKPRAVLIEDSIINLSFREIYKMLWNLAN
ncbi:hypothetical protein A2223_03645 [Candidatus Falkowbacteria bacterium RIFOXYA2_FULL_35_8]|nr:MAG: hypothetical protein A2223_03645 [Candidatus Falkowbacteria bacterium RIFOXYA2_FULL_35_8]